MVNQITCHESDSFNVLADAVGIAGMPDGPVMKTMCFSFCQSDVFCV